MSSFKVFPEGWDVTEIKDARISIIDGDRGKNYPSKEEFSTEGFCLFLNTGNIKDDVFDFTTCDFITESKDALLRKGKLIQKDIILTTRGTVGSVAYYHIGVEYDNVRINSGMVILRSGDELIPEYLYQLFKSPILKTQYKLYSSGAAQPQLPIKDLRRIKLPLPKPKVQRKIAAILSTYDDLIENNRRRIALLEKMAEEIYHEWFVRMRFPGHEQAKFEKGVPEGWGVKRISEVVDFLSGYSFKSEIYSSVGKYGVVTIKNVQDGYFVPECTDFIEDVPSNMKKHCYLDDGDVLMSLTGNVGRVCHVCGDNLLLNQRVAKLAPELPNSTQFVFFTFNNKSMIQLIENLSLGSTAQMNLSPILLGKQKMVTPPLELIDKFEDTTLPMLKMKMFLLQQNMLLRQKRDRLLPRLISGKLPVENLDVQFPPSMLNKAEVQEPQVAHA